MAAEELAVGLAARKLCALRRLLSLCCSLGAWCLGPRPVFVLLSVFCVCVCVTSPRVEGYSLLLGLTARKSIVAQPLESRF